MLAKDEIRDAFLRETRICILTTLDATRRPVPVPVWYEWDGQKARIFTSAASPKVKNLRRDPRATLLVTNNVSEPEYWVRIEADVAFLDSGGADLAARLADRYWDMNNEGHRKTVETWGGANANLQVLEFTPKRIRSYS